MKKCPSCGRENYKEKYWCESCGGFLGSADAYIDKKPPKPRKTKKEPERVYMPGHHWGTGRWVQKSTYEWMKKQGEKGPSIGGWILIILLVMLIINYPSWTLLWILVLIFILSRK